MFLNKNKILLVKRESVYGTDSVPTVSENAIEAKNIKIEYNGDLLERDLVRARSRTPRRSWASGGPSYPSVEIKGSGTKGTAGRIGDALVACGLTTRPRDQRDVHAVRHVPLRNRLSLRSDSGNCKLHKVTGCRGTVSDFEAGKIATAEIKLG